MESSPFGREAVTQSGRPKAGQKSLSARGTELGVLNASRSKFFGFFEDLEKSDRITGPINRDLEGPATLPFPGKRLSAIVNPPKSNSEVSTKPVNSSTFLKGAMSKHDLNVSGPLT